MPSNTIDPVVSMFSTSFVAVPALSRVEPLMTSGPTTGVIIKSHASANADPSLQARPMANAPIWRAYFSPPITYGVRPLVVESKDSRIGGFESKQSTLDGALLLQLSDDPIGFFGCIDEDDGTPVG